MPEVAERPESLATQTLKSVTQALAASISMQVMRKQRFSQADLLSVSPA